MTNNTLIAALRKMADVSSGSNTLESLVQSLRRLASTETQDTTDKNGREHDKLGRFAHKESASESAALSKGNNPGGNYKDIEPSDLPTLNKVTKSKWRNVRNDLMNHVSELIKKNPDKDPYEFFYGTYDPSKEGDDKRVTLKDGFQVSFQTTGGEGYGDSGMMSDEDYDRTVDEIRKATGSIPYVGFYGGIPEISFKCKTQEQAKAIADKFAQHTICNNKLASNGVFNRDTFIECAFDRKRNQLHKYVNPEKRK